MLNHKSHLSPRKAAVNPEEINITVSDRSDCAIMITLPPAEKLQKYRHVDELKISVRELSKNDSFNLTKTYEYEKNRLLEKYDRFNSSATYMTHLGQLCKLSGDLHDAVFYLKEAAKAHQIPLLKHELGAAYIDSNKDDEAWSVFQNCDLENDITANLRIAQIEARKSNMDSAEKYVSKALSIDNTDYASRMFDGAIHLSKQEWEQAIRSFRVAAFEKDTSSVLFVNLGAAYWGLGEEEKALRALKRALYLNPLNENAALFLADVSYLLSKPEESMLALNTILSYEKKNASLWARIARAHYEIGKKIKDSTHDFKKALNALQEQLKLEEDPNVLNNIGVIYSEIRQPRKAQRFFTRAWMLAQEKHENFELPLSNLLSVLTDLRDYKSVYRISGEYLKSCKGAASDKYVSRIFLHHIISLEALDNRIEAAVNAEELLSQGVIDRETRIELLTHIFYYRTVINPSYEVIENHIAMALEDLKNSDNIPDELRRRAINNIIFSLLEFDEINRAKLLLSLMSPWIHKDSFVTATYGLFQIKKGNLERAYELYHEAISLASDKVTKERIRQRMHLELGKAQIPKGNLKLAHKHLKKAISQNHGFGYVKSEAKKLLASNQLT